MTTPLLAVRFSAYLGTVFLALGIYLPFWPLWLEWRGLDAAEIGLVLALASCTRVVASPLFGQLADRRLGVRRTALLAGLWTVASFAVFAVCDSFWPILIVQVVWTMPFSALIPLGESQAMAAAGRNEIDFGRVRLWGSLTFILGSLGAGELLTGRDPALVYWIVLAALAAGGAAALLLPRDAAAPGTALKAQRVGYLLRDPRFVLVLVTAGLLQASHAVYYGFSAIHWHAAGHSAATVGWLWAEGVVAEIVLFAVSAPLLRRLGPAGLLVLSGAAGVLRWGVLASTTALPLLIGAQLLHAFTFGTAHLGILHLIARTAPPGLMATAQTLYPAVSGGVFMTLAMLAAGPLYGSLGGGAYWAMAGLSLAGLAAALVGRERQTAQSAP